MCMLADNGGAQDQGCTPRKHQDWWWAGEAYAPFLVETLSHL